MKTKEEKEAHVFKTLDQLISVMKDGYCSKEIIAQLCGYYNLEVIDIFPEFSERVKELEEENKNLRIAIDALDKRRIQIGNDRNDLQARIKELESQQQPVKSDDSDIRESYLSVSLGGNGDYYLSIKEVKANGLSEVNSVRVSTSGGNAPIDVKIAVADLFRAMQKHALNEIHSPNQNVKE